MSPQSSRIRRRSARVALVAALGAIAPVHDAEACAWIYETYHSEAHKLPCVTDALLGYTTPHTREYWEWQLFAMETRLAIVPVWLEGLDTKGISLLYLGRTDEAEATLRRRHELMPDAYAGHANLGTLYTFTGKYDAAITHIEAAMAIEPDAHFGRERIHLALVKHLAAVAADPSRAGENMLGLDLSRSERLSGSPAKLKAAGYGDRDIDALVAMLTVYGASEHPDILYALADLLALKGMKRLAWTAYRRARAAKHPNTRELYRLEKALLADLEASWHSEGPHPGEGQYGPLNLKYGTHRKQAAEFRDRYQKWERQQIDDALPVWTEAGLTKLYAGIDAMRPRCKVAPVPPRTNSTSHEASADDPHAEVAG